MILEPENFSADIKNILGEKLAEYNNEGVDEQELYHMLLNNAELLNIVLDRILDNADIDVLVMSP